MTKITIPFNLGNLGRPYYPSLENIYTTITIKYDIDKIIQQDTLNEKNISYYDNSLNENLINNTKFSFWQINKAIRKYYRFEEGAIQPDLCEHISKKEFNRIKHIQNID